MLRCRIFSAALAVFCLPWTVALASPLIAATPSVASSTTVPPTVETTVAALQRIGIKPEQVLETSATGQWSTLLLTQPLLPGPGNDLEWSSLAADINPTSGELGALAQEALLGYLRTHSQELAIEPEQLSGGHNVAVHGDGAVIQIRIPRSVNGLPVRGSFLTAVINQGNLVLLGNRLWGSTDIDTRPTISLQQARTEAADLFRLALSEDPGYKPHLEILPSVAEEGTASESLEHRLIWVVYLRGDHPKKISEAFVDAHSGEALEIHALTRDAGARSVVGGVYPLSNDGQGASGTEQPGWPIPNLRFSDANPENPSLFADAGGNLPACAEQTLTTRVETSIDAVRHIVYGNDRCGTANETLTGDLLDLGTGPGTDCALPAGHPTGTTHANRTTQYTVNRFIESARAQVPETTLLRHGPIYWFVNGTSGNTCSTESTGCFTTEYEFFCPQSGATCSNPAEIATIIDHEMGHILDANDLTLSHSNPSEGIADAYSALRHNASCIGRGLFATPCDGYGDTCTTCTGLRDIDWQSHSSGAPHDIAFIDSACTPVTAPAENGPCGGSAHCEGMVVSEAIWDLYRRDLQTAPFQYAPARALELTTALTYQGADAVEDWFQCTDGAGTGDGCNADSGYLNFLAVDDDNGDLMDGTPHMSAIFAAFDRHGIACPSPTVQDSGCAGTPTTAPVVTATALDRQVRLEWTAVADATEYEIFRAEGGFQCATGKIKIATTKDTTFVDSALLNGREYSYVVIPKGPTPSCFGPNSSCTNVVPQSGPKLDLADGGVTVTEIAGDNDGLLDNCEVATVSFELLNTGDTGLTNLRITGASANDQPGLEFFDTFPSQVAANLDPCSEALANLRLRAQDLVHGTDLIVTVELTSDELFPNTLQFPLEIKRVESDFQTMAEHTFSFETDLEGWEPVEGLFRRSTTGGANGTSAFVEAAPFGKQRCDRIRSPFVRFSETSTAIFRNKYDVFPENSEGYVLDAASVWLAPEGERSQHRTPDAGRLYSNPGDMAPEGWWTCIPNRPGWIGNMDTWGVSSFSPAALSLGDSIGEPVQLEVIYAQTRINTFRGFGFDEVSFTDFDLLVEDTQGPQLCPGPIFVDGFESGDTSNWSLAFP